MVGGQEQGEIRGPALWVANKLRTSMFTAAPYRLFDRHVLPTLFAIVQPAPADQPSRGSSAPVMRTVVVMGSSIADFSAP